MVRRKQPNQTTKYYNMRLLAALSISILLFGCSGASIEQTIEDILPTRSTEYESSKSTDPLEVPPDLNAESIGDAMVVPGEDGVRLSSMEKASEKVVTKGDPKVLPRFKNTRVVRSGTQRWLVVDEEPGLVWPQLRDFWLSQGLVIVEENPATGSIETDWAEQSTRVKGGFFANLLSNLQNTLYGVESRHKFRSRLDRGEFANSSEIYVTHTAAVLETVSSGGGPLSEDKRIWKSVQSDPNTEAELLIKLMIFMGTEEEEAETRVIQAEVQRERAQLVDNEIGVPILLVAEDFARAWRSTGIALDKSNITIEDKDRSAKIYYVRYLDPEKSDDSGFFSAINFWKEEDKGVAYQIALRDGRDDENETEVQVRNIQGELENSRNSRAILDLLYNQLK